MRQYETIPVNIGSLTIGGKNPVVIQSMTDTDTADKAGTVRQILELAAAGSEMVRITVDRSESAAMTAEIVEEVRKTCSVPIIGDFHFNGHLLLKKYPEAARALDKFRINPGNVGRGSGRDRNFEAILEVAALHNKPIRIGVNGGSLDPELLARRMDENRARKSPRDDDAIFEDAMVESVLESAEFAVRFGIPQEKIILSAKISEPISLIRIYESLATKTELALHLGLTEAGGGLSGLVSSTAALAVLLQKRIGDTIRVSITPGANEPRTREVEVAREILQSLSIRHFSPKITSCPGCGRTTGNRFQVFAEEIQAEIRSRLPEWKLKYRDPESLQIAVMGCIVNGPGEARKADIGIFFPGKGEGKTATVFVSGKKAADLTGDGISARFLALVEDFLLNS